MAKLKSPLAEEFINTLGIPLRGWRSTPALAVMPRLDGSFDSFMMMSGRVLASGFPTLDAAHRFNLAVRDEPRLFVGTSSLEKFYAKAGGVEEAKKLVEKIRGTE